MIKQYWKQTLALIRENPLLGGISVLGTALAVAMIMVIVIVFEVRTASYVPEVNRDRTLHVCFGKARNAKGGGVSSSMLSLATVKSCFYSLATPEAVTAVAPWQNRFMSIPGSLEGVNADISFTDAAFWNVFAFRFLSGRPYTQEEFGSGIKKAVITRSIARQLYGTPEVVGKTMLVNFVPYTIGGVVEDVSMLAQDAYAMVWVPYTCAPDLVNDSFGAGILGNFRCHILARSPADFEAIRAEVDKRVQEYNAGKDMLYDLAGQPDNYFKRQNRTWADDEPDMKHIILQYALVLAILLLVPVINLSGITLSRMKKRMAELGVRKAFGASRPVLLMEIVNENFMLTLIGGGIGLLLSYIALAFLHDWLITTPMSGYLNGQDTVDLATLFNPVIFVYAFLFCLVLNLLSAAVPAWRASNANIVESLKE